MIELRDFRTGKQVPGKISAAPEEQGEDATAIRR